MSNLLGELQRRNVFRVAVAYLVGAWALLQVADMVLDNIGAPAWVMQTLLLICALALPLVIAFSWAFELTSEGLKRESEIERSESITHLTARRLDRITIALLLVVLTVVAAERLLPREAPLPAAVELAASDRAMAAVDEKSLAVLAFADLSPEGDRAYFADGISEELLNALAKIPELKVAGRTSSFAFRDQNRDLREIGEILEVAHILEGSVRTSGNRVRVTAQLIKSSDGFHLFSETYDREMTDIFAVQDDIARQIAEALQLAILGETSIGTATQTDPAVYSQYLRARQWLHSRDRALMERALEQLDRALVIDPDYAPAHAQKAIALLLLSDYAGSYGTIPVSEALTRSRRSIDTALTLQPELAEAHAVLGLWHTINQSDPKLAVATLQRALQINPNLAEAQLWLSSSLDYLGRQSEALALREQMIRRDPLNTPLFVNLALGYVQSGQLEEAAALISRIEKATGETPATHFALGSLQVARGEPAVGLQSLGAAVDAAPGAGLMRAWFGLILIHLGDYERASEEAVSAQRLVALELNGRHEEALRLYASFKDRSLQDLELREVGRWFLLQDRAADLIADLERRYAQQGGLLKNLPRSRLLAGNLHLVPVIYALREIGREEDADTLLEQHATLIDDIAANGADNMLFWLDTAEHAALQGDRPTMYAAMRSAIDRGFLSADGFYATPMDPYRKEKRFLELEDESEKLARAQRQQYLQQREY